MGICCLTKGSLPEQQPVNGHQMGEHISLKICLVSLINFAGYGLLFCRYHWEKVRQITKGRDKARGGHLCYCCWLQTERKTVCTSEQSRTLICRLIIGNPLRFSVSVLAFPLYLTLRIHLDRTVKVFIVWLGEECSSFLYGKCEQILMDL